MYIEIVWTKELLSRKHITDKLKKDFISYELKDIDDRKDVLLVCGDNKLITHGGKLWEAFEPKGEEDIIYFESGIDKSWIVTPVITEMYKRMDTSNERAFSGSDINQMISYLLSSLSGRGWRTNGE